MRKIPKGKVDGGAGNEASAGDALFVLSLVGGGIAWFLHLGMSVVVAEFGCVVGWGQVRVLGITLVAWLLLLVAVVALMGAMGATVLAYRLGGRLRGTVEEERLENGRGFTARTAYVTNLIFVFVIVAESLPIFYFLSEC
jgi:hypothetical protein